MQIGRMRDDLVEAILQANPDPVWIVDGDGEVIASNQAFARWRTTVQDDGAVSSWADAQRRALDGRAVVMDVHLVVSGIERSFAVHGYPVKDRPCAVMMAREIGGGEAEAAGHSPKTALQKAFSSPECLRDVLPPALPFPSAAPDGAAALSSLSDQGRHTPRRP